MDERKYNVIFKGSIHEQATLSLVQERLASTFKVDVEKIKIMFSKKRTIVKKNAPYELCQKVEQAFLNSGAYVDIEEVFPEGYTPESGPPPGYAPEPEYTPESEYAPEYPSETEPVYSPEPEYQPEPESEYVPEPEYIAEPAQEIVEPAPESVEPASEFEDSSANNTESTMPESALQQPLEMETESNEFEETAIPEPYKEVSAEPLPWSEPLPDGEPISEVERISEVELISDVEPISDFEPESEPESEPEPEPEFEIVEDEPEDESEPEFEIIGAEPELVSELEPDSEYEFDDMESIEQENTAQSLEMENNELMVKPPPENPYAAPLAKLTQEEDELGTESDFVYPQKLPAKNGLNWLINGFALVKRNPFAWIISTFLFMLISTIASLIPLIGAIATNLFNPVFMAGFMLGAKEQAEGGRYRTGHVFAGFSNNFGQLVLFGLIYLVVMLAVSGLIGIVFIFLAVAGTGLMNFSDPSALANISPLLILLIVLVVMLITIPIMMAYYFGPALISINQATVFTAIKMSFRACLSNMLPFLLYGLACLGAFIVVGLLIGGVAALLGMLFSKAGIFIGITGMVIVMLAIMPVFIASTYVAYKDIFYIK